jgi:glycosyltransferase involved in cell wall biosynthesis
VLSIYEGFFTGGARALHSSVVTGLHEGGRQVHSVLSIHREMHRETMRQKMEDDHCYRLLNSAGVRIASLGRTLDRNTGPAAFNAVELARAAGHAKRADVVLSLKEQPLRLVNAAAFPSRPVIVCLHRSDPENQGTALSELSTAVADGRLVAGICCAESTRAAYRAAGVPASMLHVIPNGVDLMRFRPVPAGTRRRLRRSLGIAADAGVVVFAARFDPMKNVSLFLRAAHSYLDREPAGHVVMCGPGMDIANAELRAGIAETFAADPQLLSRLQLIGVRHDMESIYAAADVVALTSSVGEAAPLCLIEGMMCGAVPVATDIGDCATIVAGHGILTSPEPAAISAAWSEAVARRAEFAPALARSRERFSQTRMIAAYATLIDRIGRETQVPSRAV